MRATAKATSNATANATINATSSTTIGATANANYRCCYKCLNALLASLKLKHINILTFSCRSSGRSGGGGGRPMVGETSGVKPMFLVFRSDSEKNPNRERLGHSEKNLNAAGRCRSFAEARTVLPA